MDSSLKIILILYIFGIFLSIGVDDVCMRKLFIGLGIKKEYTIVTKIICYIFYYILLILSSLVWPITVISIIFSFFHKDDID